MATIEVGYWIATTLKKDTAPLRCFVGQVKAVDEHGIRVTLIDHERYTTTNYGLFTDYDLFIPWANLESALVVTRLHDEDKYLFCRDASRWQDAMVKGLQYHE